MEATLGFGGLPVKFGEKDVVHVGVWRPGWKVLKTKSEAGFWGVLVGGQLGL